MWLYILKTRFSLCFFKFRGKQEMPLYGTQHGAWGLSFLLSHSINKLDDCQGKSNVGHDS